MPRPRNPANEMGRAAQVRYRKRLLEIGGAETDAVDAAISAAVAVFRHEAERLSSDKNLVRVTALEEMAASFLVAQGKKADPSLRAVRLRTRREDVADIVPLVSDRVAVK